MNDAPTPDPSQSDAVRTLLETWVNQRNHRLMEEVMGAWQHALDQFQPDPDLLTQLRVAAAPPIPPVRPGGEERTLALALDLLEGATSQSDLLKCLLDALSSRAERCALFILKQGLATLYAQRGFEGEIPPHRGPVAPPEELEALLQGATRAIRQKGPAYTALIAALSPLEAASAAIFPLLHKRKVVALVLVDSGLQPALGHPEQARAIILAASALLAALAAAREEGSRPPVPGPPPSLPAPAAPGPTGPQREAELDPRTRASAERLARVLVEDVELYFPAQVAQARAQGNLYALLRQELDRSHATFVERFGEDLETRYRIFTTTVIHQLCNDDATMLAAAPWGRSHATAR